MKSERKEGDGIGEMGTRNFESDFAAYSGMHRATFKLARLRNFFSQAGSFLVAHGLKQNVRKKRIHGEKKRVGDCKKFGLAKSMPDR